MHRYHTCMHKSLKTGFSAGKKRLDGAEDGGPTTDRLNSADAPAMLSAKTWSAPGASDTAAGREAQTSGTTCAIGSSQACVVRPCNRRFPVPASVITAMAVGRCTLLSQVEVADSVHSILHCKIWQPMQAVEDRLFNAGPQGLMKVAPAQPMLLCSICPIWTRMHRHY